jgi:hypothetical protein
MSVTDLKQYDKVLTWLFVQFLENEIKGLVRSSNNHLLQEFLEELINLKLLELLFNSLHVVKLLKFIHFL